MADKKTKIDDEPLTLQQITDQIIRSLRGFSDEEKAFVLAALAEQMQSPEQEPEKSLN